jgi:hypothetical protein
VAWPKYPGLLDKAQQAFAADGLTVPSYVAFGNHDALVQGNAAANAAFELVATGCLKPMGPVPNPENEAGLLASLLNPAGLLGTLLTNPQNLIFVPGDPKRQFVSKKQYKDVFKAGSQADGHGFDHIEVAQESASKGARGYYSWSPTPGMRFIALDTVAEAGTVLTATGNSTSDGNIDDPQFKWLRGQLEAATAADQLVVLFSHHAPESLTADAADELAPACLLPDAHGHDINPGCDLDPRGSQPIHLQTDLVGLLHQFPNAIAWVAGHSHETTSSTIPQPERAGRLLEHPRRGRGRLAAARAACWRSSTTTTATLSIFGTLLDHVGPVGGARAGHAGRRAWTSMTSPRPVATMSFNDFQSAAPLGEGEAKRPQRRAAAGRPPRPLANRPRALPYSCGWPNSAAGASGR